MDVEEVNASLKGSLPAMMATRHTLCLIGYIPVQILPLPIPGGKTLEKSLKLFEP